MECNIFLLFCGEAQWKLHLLNTMLSNISNKMIRVTGFNL